MIFSFKGFTQLYAGNSWKIKSHHSLLTPLDFEAGRLSERCRWIWADNSCNSPNGMKVHSCVICITAHVFLLLCFYFMFLLFFKNVMTKILSILYYQYYHYHKNPWFCLINLHFVQVLQITNSILQNYEYCMLSISNK